MKKKLPHADLILPWPWNQVERVDFRILGFGVRGRELRRRESWVSMRERERVSRCERDLNDVGPLAPCQPGSTGLTGHPTGRTGPAWVSPKMR